MRLLLDTHVLLWALGAPEQLSESARAAIASPEAALAVSAVTALEIAIKQSIGKLQLPGPAETWLLPAAATLGVEWLPLTPEVATRVRSLPWHHRDPFDRVLVAHALDGWTLVTRDARICEYGVTTLSA